MMAELREADFKKAIQSGTLEGAYLLYGEEKYTMLQSVRKLVQKVSSAGYADFNLQRFDGTDVTAEEVAVAAEALPLFADRKWVTVSDWNMDAASAEELKKITEMIDDLPDTTVLILYLPTIELGKRLSAKWKQLFSLKNLNAVEFRRKTPRELEKYLITFAEKRNCVLSRDLASLLVARCGTDLETLSHEISKLCAFAGCGEIRREQIDAVVIQNREEQAFALSKAIIGGRYEHAYEIMDALLAQSEEPVAIVALLSSSYLNLYRVKCMVQSGAPVMDLAADFDYKGKEFLLRNAEQDCGRFSSAMLRKSLDLLLEADLALKGGAGSSRESMKRVILDELVAKLLLAAQG